MQISGDNWDAALYARLQNCPPPVGAGWNLRHEHVLRLIIDTIGPSLRGFLRDTLSHVNSAVHETDGDAVHRFVDSFATYYLIMHQAMNECGPEGLDGWDEAISQARALSDDGKGSRVFLTFQLGLPLLCPIVLAKGSGRPIRVLMHLQNPFVESFYRRRPEKVLPLFLETLKPFDIVSTLNDGHDVIANIDVSYPGTRSLPMAILDASLHVPSGLPLIARRARARLQPLVLVVEPDRHVRLLAGPGTTSHGSEAADQIARMSGFFENVVRCHPFQWFGWPALKPPGT